MDNTSMDYLTGVGTAVIAICAVLTLLYHITAHFLEKHPAFLENCRANIKKYLHNCSSRLQSKSPLKVLGKYPVILWRRCSLKLLGIYACNLVIGAASVILAIYAANIVMNINTAREKAVQSMISQVTHIIKKSEKRTQENTEDMLLKLLSYEAPPELQDATIKKALDRARVNGYLFDIYPNSKDPQNYIVPIVFGTIFALYF